MLSWFSWLSEIFKDSNGHWIWPWVGATILTAGTVITAVASGAWTVFKFVVERKKVNEKKGGDRNVKVDQGFGAGHDQTFQGPVTFGPSKEQIAQIQEPLAKQLSAQNAELAEVRGELTKIRQEAKVLLAKSKLAEAAILLLTKGIPAVFKFLNA
jgi:hypothetical protein